MKPLTDEEILELMRKYPDHLSQNSARAIEAAVNAKWETENKRLREALESIHNLTSGSENLSHLIEIAARTALKGDV